MLESLGWIQDRLIAECIKVHDFEQLKLKERQKDKPNARKIAEWDKGSRTANENRQHWRNVFDEKFAELVKDVVDGRYQVKKENRTF